MKPLKPFQAYNQCHSRLGLSLTSSCQRCPIEVLLHRDKERSACRDIVRMQPVKTCAVCACVLYTDMRRTGDHSHFTASYIYIYLSIYLFIYLFLYVCVYVCVYLFIYLYIYLYYLHTYIHIYILYILYYIYTYCKSPVVEPTAVVALSKTKDSQNHSAGQMP